MEKQPTQETYNFAAQLLVNQKQKPDVVKNTLIQQGYSQVSANTVVDALLKTIAENGKKKAKADMRIGIVVAIIGAAITAITYSMASGGGTYVVAWGAVVFGGLQFFRGLINSAKYK